MAEKVGGIRKMTTYKDIVKDIFDSVNYNANEQEISKARNVLIKDLKDVPVEQFLFIEDGSIDLTELKDLKRRNPEIKIVIYRQGSATPILKDW